MKKNTKIILCYLLLILGIAIISTVLILEKPDNIIGFLLCLSGFYLILGSIIKLCKISEKFKNSLICAFDMLFWIK